MATPPSSASLGEANVTFLPSIEIIARGQRDGASDRLAERRFARAVLAEQRVNLAARRSKFTPSMACSPP